MKILKLLCLLALVCAAIPARAQTPDVIGGPVPVVATSCNGGVITQINTNGTVVCVPNGAGATWQNQGSTLGVPSIVNCLTNLTCSLSAGTLTISAPSGGFTPQINGTNFLSIGINFLASTTNACGLTNTPSNPATTQEKNEITGTLLAGCLPAINLAASGAGGVTGQLPLAQLNGGSAPGGQSYDFTGVTLFKLRVGAGLTTSVNGDFGFDSTNSNWHGWNGVDLIFAPLAAGFTSGHCGQPTSSSGKWTIVDAGAVCGSGGGPPTVTEWSQGSTAAGQAFAATVNTVFVSQITIPVGVTFSHMYPFISVTDAVGTDRYSWGLYTTGGTAICTTTATALTSATITATQALCTQTTPITITAGSYIITTTGTATTATFNTSGISFNGLTGNTSSTASSGGVSPGTIVVPGVGNATYGGEGTMISLQ